MRFEKPAEDFTESMILETAIKWYDSTADYRLRSFEFSEAPIRKSGSQCRNRVGFDCRMTVYFSRGTLMDVKLVLTS